MEENKKGSIKMEAHEETGKRPSIFIIGCPNVGKRTLLSGLPLWSSKKKIAPKWLSMGLNAFFLLTFNTWTINTKYYSVDVSLCMAHLQDGFSVETLPIFDRSTALVMVFVMSNVSILVFQVDGPHYDFEDLEQLMSEIGNIRSSFRLMPDFQRREMAAKLAFKMVAMFGGGSDGEDEI